MISFKCACGRSIKAKDQLAGKMAKCPHCGQVLTIPAGQVQAPVPQVPAAAIPMARPAPVQGEGSQVAYEVFFGFNEKYNQGRGKAIQYRGELAIGPDSVCISGAPRKMSMGNAAFIGGLAGVVALKIAESLADKHAFEIPRESLSGYCDSRRGIISLQYEKDLWVAVRCDYKPKANFPLLCEALAEFTAKPLKKADLPGLVQYEISPWVFFLIVAGGGSIVGLLVKLLYF
ncbi:MAG: hypothetical protein LLG01_19565 [Planctomycetaceae bacterium]|nr:hypothetical protein [Planctomycetaceae bacterium]